MTGVHAFALEINESKLPQKNSSEQIRVYFLVIMLILPAIRSELFYKSPVRDRTIACSRRLIAARPAKVVSCVATPVPAELQAAGQRRANGPVRRCFGRHDGSAFTAEFGLKLLPNGASAGEAAAGKDVQPLHHAEILMGYNVAVRNKAPDCLRRKMNPKGDRPDRVIVDIWLWEIRSVGVRY